MILLLLFLCALSSAQIIKTNLGDVRGYERISRDGRRYMSYTGIPYAKPPVGKLRFKNPEPVDPWKGELDATNAIPMCAQTNQFFRLPNLKAEVNGQEDCLYLNIYVPKVAAGLPVLLHIHGGGFKIGYPGPNEMADYFMDEAVILVTVTYRLSVFGFISHEDDVIPGNFGLKDQAMAIKWVRENIESFGGNPHLITVFGESAGGGSAHFHLFSPLSRDLVKGAISESGTVNRIWTLAPSGLMRSRTLKLAENLGCPLEPQQMLECLQNVDFKTLTLLSDDLIHFWDMDDVAGWRPVLERSAPGAFLVEDPLKTPITKPWMTGCTAGEGLFRTSTLRIKPKEVVDDIARKYYEITSFLLNMDPNDPNNRNKLDIIHKRFYKSNESEDLIRGYEKFFAETYFLYPLQENILRHQGPLYVYKMEYRGEGTLLDYIMKFNHSRPDHIDETFLLFNLKERYGLKGTPSDVKISKEVVKLWVNFGKFQNPSPKGSNIDWPEYGKGKTLLRITSKGLIIGENGWVDVYDFWNGIFQ